MLVIEVQTVGVVLDLDQVNLSFHICVNEP